MKIPKNKWIYRTKINVPYETLVIAFIDNPQFPCQFMDKKGTVSLIRRLDMDECIDMINYLKFPITDVYMWRKFPEAPKEYKHLEVDFSDENPIGKLKHPLHLFLDQIEKKPDDFMHKIYELSEKYTTHCWVLSDLIRGDSEMFQFLGAGWGTAEGWKKRYQKYWNQFLR